MKQLYLLATLFGITFNLSAQTHSDDECGTQQKHEWLMLNDPQYVTDFTKAQAEIASRSTSNPQARTAGTVYKIPIVVHVMHLGTPVGTGANISDDQIYSAIWSLNNAYRKKAGTAGDGNGVDAEIEFCLAQKDPSGQPHSGINRVDASSSGVYATDGITSANETTIKALSKWSNLQYYNIWLVTEIENNNGGGGTQGYAYFPGASSARDGAVILYNAFGFDPTGSRGYNLKSYTNYNVTAIHEIGHGLNLYHTFQGDASGTTCPTDADCGTNGDCVGDTPPHIRSSGCPSGTNSCTSTSETLHAHNYLDYSSDDCQNEFTAGQVTRMRNALASYPRSNLVSSTNLTNCGCDGSMAPIVRFTVNKTNPCPGEAIQFNDESINFPTSWLWTFPNGTPSTTYNQNPTPSFVGTGPYSISLRASSSLGQTNTLTKPNLISPVALQYPPLVEDFESATFPPTGWTTTSSDAIGITAFGVDGRKQWTVINASGNGTSTKSAAINCANYTPGSSATDALISPSISLSGVTSPSLTFRVAHKNYPSASFYDELRVFISTDCGNTYGTEVYFKSGPTLATNGSSSSSFIPSISNDWRTETIDISAYAGQTITLKFEVTNEYGNNIFIDDINISGSAYPAPVANFVATSTIMLINSDSTTFYDNSTGKIVNYSWDFGSGATLPAGTSGVGPHLVKYSTAGLKTVTLSVFGANGNDSEQKISYINVTTTPTGIFDAQSHETSSLFSVSPNPARDQIKLMVAGQRSLRAEIYNASGAKVLDSGLDLSGELSIAELMEGIYLIKVFTDQGNLYTKKLVIRN